MAALVTPWVLTSFQVSFLCWRGRNVSECTHACVKQRLLATTTQVHMLVFFFFTLPDAQGHFGSHRHTHTINALLPLWKSELSALWQANLAIWLDNLQWCGCQKEPTAVPLVVQVKGTCFPQTYTVREKAGGGGGGDDRDCMWEHLILWEIMWERRRERQGRGDASFTLLFLSTSNLLFSSLILTSKNDGKSQQTTNPGLH